MIAMEIIIPEREEANLPPHDAEALRALLRGPDVAAVEDAAKERIGRLIANAASTA